MVVHNIFLGKQLAQSKATTLKEEPIWPIKTKICASEEKEAFASKLAHIYLFLKTYANEIFYRMYVLAVMLSVATRIPLKNIDNIY